MLRWCCCVFIFSLLTFPLFSQQKNHSSFGKVFTPKGDLRILIIYAGFDGDTLEQEFGEWKPAHRLPPWKPTDLFYSDFSDFKHYQQDSTVRNISKYYYEMSGPQPQNRLRIVADILPSKINITPEYAGDFAQCNRLVMEKMKSLYPDFDWSRYDKRTNFPRYILDNSISKPDMKPDYVIIAYRYWSGWKWQPKQEMRSWTKNYSVLDGLHGMEYNGYTFDGAGFTLADFEGRINYFQPNFIHELAHELFSCPHYSGANGAIGNYFHLPYMGWDMMNSLGGASCNAFERWLLGWSEISHDLKDYKDNGTYTLHDFITTGESIRIQIPFTDHQFLWIEHHEKKSVFDHKPWRGLLENIPPGSAGIPDKEAGVYMFIESVVPNRNAISESQVYDINKVNGIYPLHAGGNFDYLKPEQSTLSPHEYWNNLLYWFKRGKENPLSGSNPYIAYRNDMDNNGRIENIPASVGAFNGMRNTESFPIVKEVLNGTPTLTYANGGGRNTLTLPYRRSDAFQTGDQLGTGYNPMLTNRPMYNWNASRLQPFFLNGLYIKVLQRKNGAATLNIRFNRTEINDSARWCGNIVLNKIPFAAKGYDLWLKKGARLRLDLSGTPNKHLPPFVNPTVLTIDSGAVMYADAGSCLSLLEGSRLVIKKGGILKIGNKAKIIVEEGSRIELQEGAQLLLSNSAAVEAPDANCLFIDKGAFINRKENIVVTGE